jgi:dihydroorotate dehydrogenase (NAD+) catalytic subunit
MVNIGGLKMDNPVTVASGTFAAGREYGEFFSLRTLGAVTTKGVSLEPWRGNETPRIAETPSGMLNSIGLQNPGVEFFCNDTLPWLAAQDVPVIVNVCSHTKDGFVPVIERLERESTPDAYEINVSCPNVDSGGMSFGIDAKVTEDITARCRAATKRPLFVKLTPNVTDISQIAQAAESAGADAVSMVNTVAGLAIDAHTRKPILARGMGGLSGPAIKPIALYAVDKCYHAIKIPIIGMGGIVCAQDAIEFILAGASAVAIGTGNFIDPMCVPNVIHGIYDWCKDEGVLDIRELVGALGTN